jgi:hypothetical protein
VAFFTLPDIYSKLINRGLVLRVREINKQPDDSTGFHILKIVVVNSIKFKENLPPSSAKVKE